MLKAFLDLYNLKQAPKGLINPTLLQENLKESFCIALPSFGQMIFFYTQQVQ